MSAPAAFLERPGQPGSFGALLDEYARAAHDFCTAVESVPPDLFLRVRESPDPETVSIQAVCAHAVSSAYSYAIYVREARGLPRIERPGFAAQRAAAPDGVRPLLVPALRLTEESVAGLTADEAAMDALRFQVRWGPTYDPEMMLEHAIVHLLRHRRQIERWPR